MGVIHRWIGGFQGLETKLHQVHVQPHQWLAVENADMNIRGAFGTQTGYDVLTKETLTGATIDTAEGESLFWRHEELLTVWGRRLYSYVEPVSKWVDKGPWTRGILRMRQLVDSPAEQTEPDSAEVDGIGVAMWSESTGLYYRVYTSADKSVLTENILINASWDMPRVVPLGDRLVLVAHDGAGGINAALVLVSAPTAALVWFPIITTAPGDPHYDAKAETANTFLVATTNGSLVEVHRIDQELGVIGANAFSESPPPVGPIAVSPGPAGTDRVLVAHARTATDLRLTWLDASLMPVLGPDSYGVPGGVFNISLTQYAEPAAGGAAQVLVAIEERESPSGVDAWRSRVEYVRADDSTGANPLYTQYGVALAAHGCLCDGEIYQPLVYPGVVDGAAGSVYVVQAPLNRPSATAPGEIVARGYELGRAHGLRTEHLGTTTVDGLELCFAARYRTRFKADPTDTTYFAQTAVGQMCVNLTARSCAPAQLAGSLWVAMAGALRCYDGGLVGCEAGYHVVPEIVAVASTVAGLVANGTYTIAVVYEDVDEQDRLVVSGIASTSHTVSGGAKRLDITVTNLRLTERRPPRPGVRLAVYLSEDGVPGRLYRVTSISSPPQNDPTVDSQVIQINTNTGTADWFANLEPLYTDGGVFSFDPTPATEWCAVASDRLWTRDPERPWLVRASNVLTEGIAPSFNVFTGVEAPFEATVHGFAEQEGVYYLMGAGGNQLAAFHGDGPPPTTTGGWTDPVEVRTDLGCTAQETITQITDGVIFGTIRGPRLLTGGRVVAPFYEPVERYFLRYGQQISAIVYRPDSGDVFIGSADNEQTEERRRSLRYNVTTQRWCSDQRHNAIDAAVSLGGRFAFLRWDGRACLGQAHYWAGEYQQMLRVATPWFRIDDSFDPLQLIARIQVIGDVLPEDLAGQRIRVALAYDYEVDYVDAITWDPAVPRTGAPGYASDDDGHGVWAGDMGWGGSNSTIGASGLPQIYERVQTTRQITRTCQAVSVEVTLLPSASPARGMDIAGVQVSLEYPDVPGSRFDQPVLLQA